MNSNFFKIGLSISVVAVGGSLWMERRMQNRFKDEDYYQQAVIMLHKYEPGAQILGRPMYSGRLDLGNKDGFALSPLSAKLSIPVKGSKQDGILHVLASKQNMDRKDKWNIDQLDLELKTTGQRWKFYERSSKQEDSNESMEDTALEYSPGQG